MRTTAGPKGEPCLERAVAGNYSGVDASRCSCPISAGGIVWRRRGEYGPGCSRHRDQHPRQSSISHLASRALICIEEKLNREMQIPLNNLTKLMAPVEPGLGLVGAQGEEAGWQSLVGGERAGGVGQLDPQPLSRGCCWPSVQPCRCPLLAEMTHFSGRRDFVPSRGSQAHARSRWSPS